MSARIARSDRHKQAYSTCRYVLQQEKAEQMSNLLVPVEPLKCVLSYAIIPDLFALSGLQETVELRIGNYLSEVFVGSCSENSSRIRIATTSYWGNGRTSI